MSDSARRGRQQFLLLAALFFAPLVAAVLLYFVFPQWLPSGHTNHGELLGAARAVPVATLHEVSGADAGPGALRGKWSYVYLGDAGCEAACADKLRQIRQVRALLNEKRLRVRRVYIASTPGEAAAAEALLGGEHADLEFYADTPDAAYRRFFGGEDPHALYLVDPLGNWLMIYPQSATSEGLLKDIKRLLRVSQIG